jgi:hypothetical protein
MLFRGISPLLRDFTPLLKKTGSCFALYEHGSGYFRRLSSYYKMIYILYAVYQDASHA